MKPDEQRPSTMDEGPPGERLSFGREEAPSPVGPAGSDPLARLRHDLRNHANAILGYSEMLLESSEEMERPDLSARLETIHTHARSLTQLIERLLIGGANDPAREELLAERALSQLRQPVNDILSQSEILLESALGPVAEELVPDLLKIRTAGKGILGRIDGLQDGEGGDEGLAEEEAAKSRAAAFPAEPVNRATARGHLLVVDDHPANRDILSRRLQRQGYRVSVAEDGRQALEKVDREDFDLILLDIMMPGMNGYQVLERLKAHPTWQHIPVIMISALDEIDAAVRCIEMGAEDYLTKRFDPVLLRARIGASLGRKQVHDVEVRQKRRTEDLLNFVISLAGTMTGEEDLDHLLETILLEAKRLCNADAGTLYLREHEALKWVIIRNDSLDIALGGTTGKPIKLEPLPLRDPESGRPNEANVAVYVALTGQSTNIPDAYQAEGFDFSGMRAFDERFGYRSQSFLTIPLKDHRQEVIGVLQLINATDPQRGEPVPFDAGLQQLIEPLSLLASAILESYVREQGLREQVQSLELRIEIDELKRARQVSEITETEYFSNLMQEAQRRRSRLRD